MKPGDLVTGTGRLHESMKSLRLRWNETQEVWDDVRRREFEAQYLTPLESQLTSTLEKMRRLAQVFAQARQECS